MKYDYYTVILLLLQCVSRLQYQGGYINRLTDAKYLRLILTINSIKYKLNKNLYQRLGLLKIIFSYCLVTHLRTHDDISAFSCNIYIAFRSIFISTQIQITWDAELYITFSILPFEQGRGR